MANQLGVSAPAVNKWEKGISYPDISILAPLARLLKIDTNELLSFQEELSEQEIAIFIKPLSEDITAKGIEELFNETIALIKQYPNCNQLILWSAQILNGYLVMKLQDVVDVKKYEEQIAKWFEQVAFCDDTELAKSAQMSLAQSLMKDKKYGEAQKLLDKIPPIGFDKRIAQVQLYTEQEQYDEAFKELEEMLYRNSNGLMSTLLQIISLLCKQKDYDEALKHADLVSQVSSLFDLGSYAGNSTYFTIYAEMGDKDLAIDALEKMMNGYETMRQAGSSNLYRHMKFSEDDGLDKMKAVILKSFDNDPSFDFIRNESRYKKLYDKLIK
ncbi:MAG: helix-turn-helix domain-containing protein [Anaerocolumna sp.]